MYTNISPGFFEKAQERFADSLIAVEVRYWFMKQLRVDVSVLNILKDQSLSELCCSVLGDLLK